MSWQDDEQLLERLLALADGELSPQDRPAMLAYLAEHPEAARWLSEQAQLTAAVRLELIEHAAPTPASLRQRVERLSLPPRRRIAPVHLNWLTAAAATIVLGWLIFRGHDGRTTLPVTDNVIPANVVAHASRVHDDCSRVIEVSERLHAGDFPKERGALAEAIEKDIHRDQPIPDLTSLGFHYVGAGPCGDPLADAIHLLYHSDQPHTNRTISVFVQPFTRQYALERSKVYSVAVAQSPFPMLAWRSESVVYFLLSDDEKTEQAALAILHPSSMEQYGRSYSLPRFHSR